MSFMLISVTSNVTFVSRWLVGYSLLYYDIRKHKLLVRMGILLV
jgi:hypothetical protein